MTRSISFSRAASTRVIVRSTIVMNEPDGRSSWTDTSVLPTPDGPAKAAPDDGAILAMATPQISQLEARITDSDRLTTTTSRCSRSWPRTRFRRTWSSQF